MVGERISGMKKRKKRVWAVMISLIMGMSVLAGCQEDAEQWQISVSEEYGAPAFYGVTDSDLTVRDIVWKDYPGWKTVSFQADGNITLQVPAGANIVIGGLAEAALQEKSRETAEVAGEAYDVVELEIQQATVEDKVSEVKEQDDILKATRGYHWKVLWSGEKATSKLTEGEYIIGCIMPQGTEMQLWSAEENQYAERNLQPYFEVFRLSRTYTDATAQNTYPLAEGIELKKLEGDVFCFELTNKNKEDWFYHPVLPAVELWYDGVWIEVESPYAETAMASRLRASETVAMRKSDKEVNYPYLFPGLYRLVYYGEDGDCVISDVFEVR